MGDHSVWRKDKRERGICGENGCWVPSGDEYRCDACKKKNAAQRMARYWAKKTKREGRPA